MGSASCCDAKDAAEAPSRQEARRIHIRGANKAPLAAAFLAGSKSSLGRTKSGLGAGVTKSQQGHVRPSRTVQSDLAKATYSDFTQCSTLGTGAFGCVKLCRHRVNGETCALKITHKNHCEAAAKDGKLYESAAIGLLTKIDHPFVIRTYRTFWEGDQVYTLMEVGDGGAFSKQIIRGGLAEEVSRFYAAEMALAIGALHDVGIVYHDLKPDNLLLTANGHIKLIDFGLAAINESKSKSKSWCSCGSGTPNYMAPELILSQPHGAAVDWWALGVVVYEMACGTRPFGGAKGNLVNQICNGKVDMSAARHLGDQGKRFCEQLLAVDEDSRLGASKDIKEIKSHKWFSSIDWSKLLSGHVSPPIVPGNQLDAGGGFSGAMFAASGGVIDAAQKQQPPKSPMLSPQNKLIKKKSLKGKVGPDFEFRSKHQ